MRKPFNPRAWLPLLAAAALAMPQPGWAQAFSADYWLPGALRAARASSYSSGALSVDGFHISPTLQGDGRFSGAGLSLDAGRSWFAQVAVGRSLQHGNYPFGMAASDEVRVSGGYRWGDGQALSLQVTGGSHSQRLGLAVRYDWPRYFVRLSYDSGLNPLPQDNLRFSAGVRF